MDAKEFDSLKTRLFARSDQEDSDLELKDRSTRTEIAKDINLVQDQVVTLLDGTLAFVIGPGRGENTVLCAYTQPDPESGETTFIGSFSIDQIEEIK